MAVSGFIAGTTNSADISARLYYQQTIDNTNNRSTIQTVFKVYNSGAIGQAGRGKWTITVNGTTQSVDIPEISFYRAGGWITVTTKTFTVPHNNDGTKTCAMSVTGGFVPWEGQPYTSTSLSGSVVLDPTDVVTPTPSTASVTSAVTVNGTNKCQVTITRQNAAYTHTVRWYINNTYTYTKTGVGTSAEYAIPLSWLAYNSGGSTITAHVSVTTFNGSAQIGSAQVYDFTLNFPAASTATVTSTVAIDGTAACDVTISRAVSSFKHTVRWYIDSTYTHTKTDQGASSSYAIPRSWLASMPTTTSITGHVTVTTFSGTTQIRSAKTYDFTLTVPASEKPGIASGWCSVAPVNSGLPAAWSSLYVKGYSKIKATFNGAYVTVPTGTSIARYSMTCNGVVYGSAQSYTSAVLTTAGSLTVTVSVKDARGRQTNGTRTVTVRDYSAPAITTMTAVRTNSQGTPSAQGSYIKVKANATFSSVNGNNTLTLTVATKQQGGSYGTAQSLTNNTDKILSGFSTTKGYTVRVQATDTAGNTAEKTLYVSAGEPDPALPSLLGMNLYPGGTGAAFGKVAENGWLSTNFASGFHLVQGALKHGSTILSETQLKLLMSLLGLVAITDVATTVDDITQPGIYYVGTVTTPYSGEGILIFLGRPGVRGMQILVRATASNNYQDIFYRTVNMSTWAKSAWKVITAALA